jgi:hypothetical protein
MSELKVEPSVPQNSCNLLMQDSRMFTDYRPRDQTNAPLGATMNSHAYRQHLIANASSIIKENLNKLSPQDCQEEYPIDPPPQPLYPKSFV